MLRKGLLMFVVALVLACTADAPAGAATLPDYTKQAFNILAPGETGGLPVDAHSTDQLKLYDALTPLQGNVSAADIARLYKSERFGVQGPVIRREDTGRPGLSILRDSFDVAHVYGQARDDVMFGSGWVAAEDRGLLLQQGRGPGYVSALDVPGVDAFGLIKDLKTFIPSEQAKRFVAGQQTVLLRAGRKGRRILRDIDQWVAGVNAYYAKTSPPGSAPVPFTRADEFALFSFIGSIFGNGGGKEVGNAALLAGLRRKLGPRAGLGVFRDLRERNDPEAPVSTKRSFPYALTPQGRTPGSLVIDAGSQSASSARAIRAQAAQRQLMSNFLVAGASRSADRHPLAVMGPQLGYFYPEIFMEEDLHGGGIDVRGGVPPVSPYVLIGRAKDYAWSLTTASNDNTDQFLEQLCNPNRSRPTRASNHYLFKGRCRAMRRFDAGLLKGSAGQPDRELTFLETVHGPVSGTVTVHGRPYAVSKQRSTRGREPASLQALSDLNENRPHDARSFFRSINQMETTFNWPYVDSKHFGYFSSGRLPIRAPGTDPDLPTLGTGRYEWRGFLSLAGHPQDIDPRGGLLLNWNNKPARDFGAADDAYSRGSAHRVELFRGFKGRNRLENVVSVMNRAATKDFRAEVVWPLIRRVLKRGTAPSPRAEQAAELVDAWRRHGTSRLDRNLDGKVDDPGAAVIDGAWPGISDAVLSPVLGGLTSQFADLSGRDDRPDPGGSSFGGGWYEYIDKDLRTQLDLPVKGRFSRRYCGRGSLRACRASLWRAVQGAADRLAATQGPNPAAWRSDANAERIKFIPGLLPDTMRWTNRPTFQQVIEFGGHRR